MRHTELWSQQVKCIDSSLIKKFLYIRNEMLAREGYAIITFNKLIVWLTQTGKGNNRVYEYFREIKINSHGLAPPGSHMYSLVMFS